MNPRVQTAKPLEDYILLLTFTNSEEKFFDCKPYLNTGIFKMLQDKAYFNDVKVSNGTVQWRDEQDFCPDTLYIESYQNQKISAWHKIKPKTQD